MVNLILVMVAILLVLINGFFVAAEFALVKLRSTRVQAIKKLYGWPGTVLAEIHSQLDAYLSACQLGITLASLGLGWVGEPAFADLFEPLLHKLGITSHATIATIAFAVAFLLISFLHIVVGELAPKSLAIRQAQKVSLWTSVPLYIFYWLMYPFIWLLNKSANLILKPFGIASNHETESTYSADELKLIVNSNPFHGELEKEEVEILDNVLDFADLKVADIMRPAEELAALDLAAPFNKNLAIIKQYHYSRYPVYQNNFEHIIGMIHVKDIFMAMQEQSAAINLQSLMRPILAVDTELDAVELFRKFRQNLTHFAIIKNTTDNVVGFVTLDNILHVLLGRIGDEFIQPQMDWITTEDNTFIMKGNTPLYLLEKALNIKLDIEYANTISGLILKQLERLPNPNEVISLPQFDIAVLKIKGPKILLVKIYPHNKILKR